MGISTRSERAMARDTMRLAVPSRSTRTNWRPARSASITGTIWLSLTSPRIRTVLIEVPRDQARIGWFGSQSISDTLAPRVASVVPMTSAVVDLPAPPLGFAIAMTGTEALPTHRAGRVAAIAYQMVKGALARARAGPSGALRAL